MIDEKQQEGVEKALDWLAYNNIIEHSIKSIYFDKIINN